MMIKYIYMRVVCERCDIVIFYRWKTITGYPLWTNLLKSIDEELYIQIIYCTLILHVTYKRECWTTKNRDSLEQKKNENKFKR